MVNSSRATAPFLRFVPVFELVSDVALVNVGLIPFIARQMNSSVNVVVFLFASYVLRIPDCLATVEVRLRVIEALGCFFPLRLKVSGLGRRLPRLPPLGSLRP
jgi:hypothetical protein